MKFLMKWTDFINNTDIFMSLLDTRAPVDSWMHKIVDFRSNACKKTTKNK